MPEGPEIIMTTQYIQSIIGDTIQSVTIIGGRYTHEHLEGFEFLDNLPFKINAVNSKGKFIWFEMEDVCGEPVYIMNTLGLTGKWTFVEEKTSRIRFLMKSEESGLSYELFYSDARNFGTMKFTQNQTILNKKLSELAPDILKSGLTVQGILDRFSKYTDNVKKDTNIVKILMDQSAVVSGIGNYLVAEILYDAKINPHRKITGIAKKELANISHSIRKVAKKAYINNNSGYMENFGKFLEKHRKMVKNGELPDYHPDVDVQEKFEYKVYRKDTDPFNNKVSHDEIVKGRKIHWVPAIQR